MLLERSGNLAARALDGAVTQDALDTLDVEKERGITVKAVTASMLYEDEHKDRWLINLIDTPGHADFAHEVRSSAGILFLNSPAILTGVSELIVFR